MPEDMTNGYVVHKISVKSQPGHTFVLSDEQVDRYGDVIMADGWQLKNFKKNPIALFGHQTSFPIGNWKNVRVEGNRLLGDLELAAEGTSARIDELRRLVDQGILKAVSVGFLPLEYEPLDEKDPYGGYRFLKQELFETSLVSVPANPGALQLAKSLNISEDTLRLAFGEQVLKRQTVVPTGKQAVKPKPKDVKMNSLSDKIEAAQTDLNGARDALTAFLDSGEDDPDQVEAMSTEIELRESRLTSLQRAEKALAARTPAPASPAPVAPAVRRPLDVPVKEPAPRDLIVRAAVVKLLSHLTGRDTDRILEERYRDHEATHVVTRAAVAGATTTTAGWAAELVQTAVNDFLESLRPISVYPRLSSLGVSMNFGPNSGAIKIPSRASTPSISGSFVAEGSPIPVRKLGLTSITLSPHKMGVISYFTREIARYGTPAIEGIIRGEIEADTAITLDTLLLDNNAASATRPAGLTAGVSGITVSSATDKFQRILDDISSLAAPFDTANAGRRLALIMNPAEARKLAMAPGPSGVSFGWANQFLEEFERIVSTTVAAGTVYMIDAADFATAAGDAPEFDVSDQAVLHAEDTAPTAIGTAGSPAVVAAPVHSMFQTAQTAIRMLMDVSWAMRRSGMVQFGTSVSW